MPGVSPQRGAVRNVVQGASAGSAADPASDLRNIMIPMWFRVRSACMKRPRANDRRELITSVLALVMAAWPPGRCWAAAAEQGTTLSCRLPAAGGLAMDEPRLFAKFRGG